jgi:hypothetical protein
MLLSDETKKGEMGVTCSIHREGEGFVQCFRKKTFEEKRSNGRLELGDQH